jgi:hypothetical protein
MLDLEGRFMKYVRCYADPAGETHFSDVEIELTPVDFAPPAPLVNLSPSTPTEGLVFLSLPTGWYGDWHPAPRRQFCFVLRSSIELEVSDGEVRRFVPGGAFFVEDTTGKGHTYRVVGLDEHLLAIVQLPDS